jgi:hypothetical protein
VQYYDYWYTHVSHLEGLATTLGISFLKHQTAVMQQSYDSHHISPHAVYRLYLFEQDSALLHAVALLQGLVILKQVLGQL